MFHLFHQKFIKKVVMLPAFILLTAVFYFSLDLLTKNDNQIVTANLYISSIVKRVTVEAQITPIGYVEGTDQSFTFINKASVPKKVVAQKKVTSNIPISVGRPSQLMIPKIGVSANVLHLGLTAQGAVAAPEGAYDVSWYNLGPKPGQQGSAVISGHSGIWRNGSHSIFDNLKNLSIGDRIQVKDENGNLIIFEVSKMNIYGRNDSVPEVFSRQDGAYLNIITCYGNFIRSAGTYDKRLIVFAKRV